jgi:hypothetical protein
MRRTALRLFFSSLAFLSCAAAAEEPAPVPDGSDAVEDWPRLWITSGFLSHHFNRDRDLNENNAGLGSEVQFNRRNAISAGMYRNSLRNQSRYAQYVWTPLAIGDVRLGATVGMVDGYPQLNGGRPTLALMPIASYAFTLLSYAAGINLVYIPTIASRIDGSLSLQLKVRVH